MCRTKKIDINFETRRFKDLQEVIKKLVTERNDSKMNTAKKQTVSFFEICSALARSPGANDALYEEVDCFLQNEPARKALIRF